MWMHGAGFAQIRLNTKVHVFEMATRFAKRGYVCLSDLITGPRKS